LPGEKVEMDSNEDEGEKHPRSKTGVQCPFLRDSLFVRSCIASGDS